MLSAVELHSGGGSGFYTSHHHPTFGRPLAPTGSSDVQYSTQPQMSEFARPKPKSIGSSNASLNGLSPSAISPPTHKYSHHLHPQQQQQQQLHEQNGPVNLAVNHHQSTRQQQQQQQQQHHSTSDKEHSEKEIDVVGLGSGNSGNPLSFSNTSSSRIPSFPAGLGSNAYQALNYNFYGNRYNNPHLFPHRYPQHHTSRPTYLDAYSSAAYLSATYGSSAYSSASSPLTQSNVESLSPSAQQTSAAACIAHKSSNDRSHSMSSLSNGHQHHQQQQQQQHHPYAMKEKEPKSAGPRLTGNIENQINNFKVPSGKEGSLKHRILTTTRPHEINKHGTINHPAHRPSINNNSYLNFTRGSLIELSNGSLRRVEDLRTEDFVLSAEKSQDLQLADSTVVKILPANNNFIMITFSYDNNRSKVDIEAKMEHPFFVYGQGWASCDTEGSMQAFGLKCQRLQVGDVCISLKPREQKLSPPLSPMAQQKRPREMFQHLPPTVSSLSSVKEEMMPQNLSRRPSTNTTTNDSAISSYSSSIYNLQMSLFAAASQGRMPAAYASFLNQEEVQKHAVAAHLQSASSHESNTSSLNNNNSPDKLPMLSKNNSTSIGDDYADDLQARKRRWSAPDIDGDDQQPQQLRKISNN